MNNMISQIKMDSYQHNNSSTANGSRDDKQGWRHRRYLTGTRNFDFQDPTKHNIELKGKCVYHHYFPETKEKKYFRSIQVHEQPNSKRTIIPDYAPCPSSIKSKSSTNIKHNSNSLDFNNNISYIPLNIRKRRGNPHSYRSLDLTNSMKPEQPRREIKSVTFKKYDTTSQISLLPGSIKRNLNEIIDDKKPIIIQSTPSQYMKIYRDYRSNIYCLPGSRKNPLREHVNKKSLVDSRVNTETDIFNVKEYSTIPTEASISSNNHNINLNSFNISVSRRQNYLRMFGDSSGITPKTGIKRTGERNKSQIQII